MHRYGALTCTFWVFWAGEGVKDMCVLEFLWGSYGHLVLFGFFWEGFNLFIL